ncbi:PREDICTED: F-box/WD repeat-containing protein 10 [Elephantulus edwardii]|uniref:F-box/WD repeat-containing protein 10 n=1 Tax=Elephantulus edwardii TaxID=28737 RepID=UPI0003F0CEF2|nr:PREDICTED: F-box/WD repeat-containing protein 10 [Elephantulus edwardii]
MAEFDLMAPGPLPGVVGHTLTPLSSDFGSARPAEEEWKSLGAVEGQTEGQDLGTAELETPGGKDEDEGEGQEEILCDFCLGASRVAAVKSCLTCMVNYCEEHLRPHQENSKLHSHQLTEPMRDLDQRICPAHHRTLVAFCHSDQQCICEECSQNEHKDHAAVSLDAARRDKEAELRCIQLDLEQKLRLNKDAIDRLQANHKSVLVSVSEVKVVAEEQFGELLAAVRKAQADVMLFLEEKEQAALSQSNGIKAHLEHRNAEMEKSRQELERVAAISNSVLFLEEYCKFKNTEDSAFPSVYIRLKDKLSGIRKVITDSTGHLIQLLQNQKEKLQEFAKEEEYDISTQVSAVMQRKYRISRPEPSNREEFLQYAYNITFDPDTAHRYLRLQEDNRKVTNTTPWEHPYPEHPGRFVHWRQVLSQQSLYLHRYYFEVEISGPGTYVGLTYKGIDRKGEGRNSCISGNNFSWSLHWNGKEFRAWHSDTENPLKASPFRRLGIYIDFPGKTLSFYGVEPGTMTLVHKFECNFSEPVYAAFWLSKKENTIRIVDLGEEPEKVAPTPGENILQTMQGKDFIYSRSRIHISRREANRVKPSLNQALDKTLELKMKEILGWFARSSQETKVNYTLQLLQMCDPRLLLTASNVVRILFLKQHKAMEEEQWKSPVEGISEMTSTLSRKADIPKTNGIPFDLLVDLDTVRALSSTFSQYRDFIRLLPVHLSKYILNMLDKNTLNRCASVSQHWAILTHEVKSDRAVHTFIQNQMALFQGTYTTGIDITYANKLSIPVPNVTEDTKHIPVKNQKWKLRTMNDYNLWMAYQNQETVMVQMEERNVYCGTYNIRILSDKWDQNRIIHYSGGDLVAVSSNRNIHLLDIIRLKEIPIKFRGHTGSIHALFLCEKENVLLSGSYDLSIRCWDLKTGNFIRIFYGHQGTINCIDLCKKKLVSGGKDCQVKVWDIDTAKCLKTFKHKEPILATKINDTYIVSSCEQGMVKVWHIAMAQLVKTLTGHEGPVKCLFFDEWHLLSGSSDGFVMAWSMVGKYERCLMGFKHPREVLDVSLLFLRVISACADGKIRIYNFLNGNCLKVMKANSRGDPVLSFFIQGDRMLINTESNIIMFQFENIKWQYSQDQVKQKEYKDKEEEWEDSSFGDAASSILTYSRKESALSKQMVVQEALASKQQRPHISPKTAALSADDMGKVLKEGQLESPVESISRLQKKGWHISMSPDQFLLTVNALQQTHNSGVFAYPHRPQTQVVDNRGPSINFPRKVLNFQGKSLQDAVQKLRSSHPSTEITQTSTPLEIQKLHLNLKNSLHSSRVQSTIPQPMLIRPKLSDIFKGEGQMPKPLEGAVHSPSQLTSMHVIRTRPMIAPRMGTKTLPFKKERPSFYTTLNPFRINTGFKLLTMKEEKEYREAKVKEDQATKPTVVADPEKARKIAWLRKIKGLPIDDFMKQGKTAAPELGPNTFI